MVLLVTVGLLSGADTGEATIWIKCACTCPANGQVVFFPESHCPCGSHIAPAPEKPLLDANGWALNATARINVPFGASLTRLATLPKGAHVDMADPFADRKRPLWPYALLVIVLMAAYRYWLK
jgi:hypothetical protein